MANPERGELSVTVGGKAYTLRPTFDALCEFETLTGKSLDSMLESINNGSLSGLRAVVWCVLQDQHGDEIKVLKDASRWIEKAGGVVEVTAHLNTLMGINAPEPTETDGATSANPPDAQAGTGEASSPVLVGSV